MSVNIKELAARYGRKSDITEIAQDILNEQYHTSAFTNPTYPIITADENIQVFQWGLIPFWTKSEKDAARIRTMTYNSKAETLFELPSFREPIRKRRCLIPSTGYFEWRHEGGKKIPYFIYVKGEEIFSMAGIYDVWYDHDSNEAIYTFSLITTTANPLTAYIHNVKQRMPVILSPEDEEKWLNPHLTKKEIEALLKPYDADKMEAYVIKKDFLRKNPHDPSILEKEEK